MFNRLTISKCVFQVVCMHSDVLFYCLSSLCRSFRAVKMMLDLPGSYLAAGACPSEDSTDVV